MFFLQVLRQDRVQRVSEFMRNACVYHLEQLVVGHLLVVEHACRNVNQLYLFPEFAVLFVLGHFDLHKLFFFLVQKFQFFISQVWDILKHLQETECFSMNDRVGVLFDLLKKRLMKQRMNSNRNFCVFNTIAIFEQLPESCQRSWNCFDSLILKTFFLNQSFEF